MARDAMILVLTRGRARPPRHHLEEGLLLGRADECGIVLDDERASRRHARITRGERGWEIEDLESSNGTRRNGQSVTGRVALEPGDEIGIGDVLLVVRETSAESPTRVSSLEVERAIGADGFDPSEGESAEVLDRLKVLHGLGSSLSTTVAPEVLATRLLIGLAGAIPFDRGSLWLRALGGATRALAFQAGTRGACAPYRVSRTVLERILSGKEGILVRDLEVEEELRQSPSVVQGPTLSVVGTPLLLDGMPRGAILLESSRLGAFSVLDLELLMGAASLAALALKDADAYSRAERKATALRGAVPGRRQIVGSSPPLLRVLQEASRVGPTTASVLITGETGTGKELLARRLHEESPRSDSPFVPVDCAALSPALLESELFGHIRGAFTGAERDAMGLFRMADGGTIFLDEVAELALDLQAKLLRALEEGEVRPVGASEPTPVDVRVVSATHRDLKAEVGRGRFREDIYYRLAAITLRLPPLRERREDIPELARSLLSDLGARYPGGKAEIGSDALEALVSYRWPGNVRELRNVMERAAVLCEGGTILRSDLPPDVVEGGLVVEEQGEVFTLAAAEARAIAAALRKTGGKKGEAAKLLGISWPTLRRKLKLYGLAASTPPMRGRERPE